MFHKSKREISLGKKLAILICAIVIVVLESTISFMVLFFKPSFAWIMLIIKIIGIFCAFYIYGNQSNTSYKLSWIILLFILPLSGTFIYLLFGNGKLLPKSKYNEMEKIYGSFIKDNSIIEGLQNSDPIGYKHLRLLHRQTGFSAFQNSQSRFFSDTSEKLLYWLKDLKNAQKYIFLETFILTKGQEWSLIYKVLCEKAKAGIEIKIIYDDIGSKWQFPKDDINYLSHFQNVAISSFNPIKKQLSFGLNYRDHRKICLIDGQYVYIGGDNIGDRYINLIHPYGYWRDNGLRLEGDVTYGFLLLFAHNWFLNTEETLPINELCWKSAIDSSSIHFPFGDGPVNKSDPAYDLIISLINNAQKYVYISTPYLLIDEVINHALIQALQSGVEVSILLPHIPDKKIVFMMSRAHYRDILKYGGHIYEYTPGFNHAKNIIVDDKYALIGTINLDYRSLFLHFECADFLINDPEIMEMKKDYLKALEHSCLETYEHWNHRSLIHKAIEFFLRAISPLL